MTLPFKKIPPTVTLPFKKIPHGSDEFLVDTPHYATDGAACFDLQAAESTFVLKGKTILIPTGLAFQIPEGYKLDVYSRSGLSIKNGLALANGTGIIDSDYRGEVMVALHNRSEFTQDIERGARIAQAMLVPVPKVHLIQVGELETTSVVPAASGAPADEQLAKERAEGGKNG